MNLHLFVLCSVAAFSLFHFYLIPRATARMQPRRDVSLITSTALLSVWVFLRAVCAIAAVSTLTIVVWVKVLSAIGGSTAEEITSSLSRVQAWHARFLAVSPGWSAFAIVTLVTSIAVLSHRRTKRKYQAIFSDILQREVARLEKAKREGVLEPLPPTAEMEELDRQIERGREVYASIAREEGPQADAARAKLSELVYGQMRYREWLDLSRRVNLELDDERVKLPEAETFGEKVQALFISRGLVQGIGGFGKALYFCTIALLVPSFAGFAGATSTPVLQGRIVELRDLRMRASQTDWQKTVAALGADEEPLTAEDEAAIDRVAQAFEQQLAAAADVDLPDSAYSVRASLVSNRILTNARARSHVRMSQYRSGSESEAATPLEKWLLAAQERAVEAPHALHTSAGRAVKKDLADAARRSATVRQRIHAAATALGEPEAGHNIARALVNQIVGTMGGEVSGVPGELFSGFEIHDPRAVQSARDASRREFVSRFVRGAEIHDALRASMAPRTVTARELATAHSSFRVATEAARFDALEQKLASKPPGIEAALDPDIDWEGVARRVNDLVGTSPRSARNVETVTEFASTFGTHFPNHDGADMATPAAQLREMFERGGPEPPSVSGGGGSGGGGGGGGAGGGGGSPLTNRASMFASNLKTADAAPYVPNAVRSSASSGSAVRARSFTALRGFARVGGVLIGQTLPKSSPKLALRDLSWNIDGGKVRLTLTDSAGKTYRSRPHRVALVNQALTFAADGRPVAVTMVTAAPLPELKILVHPALVDTALGHRVIELDRFVDTFARNGEPNEMRRRVEAAEEEVKTHYALYQFAWAARLQSVDMASLAPPGSEADVVQALRALAALSSKILQDQSLRARAASAWYAQTFGRADTLLVQKDAYFDNTLVRWLVQRAGTDSNLQTLQANLAALPQPDDEEALHRTIVPPPDFEVWSGVREMTPRARIQDVLLGEAASAPPVLDFILQVAFTSDPAFGRDKDAPWEFPNVATDIRSLVRSSVARDPRSRVVLEDSEEFAMLQRLFRLALAGDLGSAFPVEKLAALSDALANHAPKAVETPRWNAQQGMVELLRLAASDSESERAYLQTVIALRRDVGVAKAEKVSLATLPPIE